MEWDISYCRNHAHGFLSCYIVSLSILYTFWQIGYSSRHWTGSRRGRAKMFNSRQATECAEHFRAAAMETPYQIILQHSP